MSIYTLKQHTFECEGVSTAWILASALDEQLLTAPNTFIITDAHVQAAYPQWLSGPTVHVVPAGEGSKSFAVLEQCLEWLLTTGAQRQATLLCVGGGVVTDLGGTVASLYMRGIRCVMVPTTLLAMVDASLGGKNGINSSQVKNVFGSTRHPAEIYCVPAVLQSLSAMEWQNGMAEVIKHALLGNASILNMLQAHDLETLRNDEPLLARLIEENVLHKMEVVVQDPYEKELRKTLNLGHTLGHAIEKLYPQPHGFAVATGIAFAAFVADALLHTNQLPMVRQLLEKYGLPAYQTIDVQACISRMKNDKKGDGTSIDFILPIPQQPARIQRISLEKLTDLLTAFVNLNQA